MMNGYTLDTTTTSGADAPNMGTPPANVGNNPVQNLDPLMGQGAQQSVPADSGGVEQQGQPPQMSVNDKCEQAEKKSPAAGIAAQVDTNGPCASTIIISLKEMTNMLMVDHLEWTKATAWTMAIPGQHLTCAATAGSAEEAMVAIQQSVNTGVERFKPVLEAWDFPDVWKPRLLPPGEYATVPLVGRNEGNSTLLYTNMVPDAAAWATLHPTVVCKCEHGVKKTRDWTTCMSCLHGQVGLVLVWSANRVHLASAEVWRARVTQQGIPAKDRIITERLWQGPCGPSCSGPSSCRAWAMEMLPCLSAPPATSAEWGGPTGERPGPVAHWPGTLAKYPNAPKPIGEVLVLHVVERMPEKGASVVDSEEEVLVAGVPLIRTDVRVGVRSLRSMDLTDYDSKAVVVVVHAADWESAAAVSAAVQRAGLEGDAVVFCTDQGVECSPETMAVSGIATWCDRWSTKLTTQAREVDLGVVHAVVATATRLRWEPWLVPPRVHKDCAAVKDAVITLVCARATAVSKQLYNVLQQMAEDGELGHVSTVSSFASVPPETDLVLHLQLSTGSLAGLVENSNNEMRGAPKWAERTRQLVVAPDEKVDETVLQRVAERTVGRVTPIYQATMQKGVEQAVEEALRQLASKEESKRDPPTKGKVAAVSSGGTKQGNAPSAPPTGWAKPKAESTMPGSAAAPGSSGLATPTPWAAPQSAPAGEVKRTAGILKPNKTATKSNLDVQTVYEGWRSGGKGVSTTETAAGSDRRAELSTTEAATGSGRHPEGGDRGGDTVAGGGRQPDGDRDGPMRRSAPLSFGATDATPTRPRVSIKFGRGEAEEVEVCYLAVLLADRRVMADVQYEWRDTHLVCLVGVDRDTTAEQLLQVVSRHGAVQGVLSLEDGGCILGLLEPVWNHIRRVAFPFLAVIGANVPVQSYGLPEGYEKAGPVGEEDVMRERKRDDHIYPGDCPEVRVAVHNDRQVRGRRLKALMGHARSSEAVQTPMKGTPTPEWSEPRRTGFRPTAAAGTPIRAYPSSLGEAPEYQRVKEGLDAIMDRHNLSLQERITEVMSNKEALQAVKSLRQLLKGLKFDETPGDGRAKVITGNDDVIRSKIDWLINAPEFQVLPPEALMHTVATSMEGTQGVTALRNIVFSWMRGFERRGWDAFMFECSRCLYADGIDPARTALETQRQGELSAEQFYEKVRSNFVTLLSRQNVPGGVTHNRLDPDTEYQIINSIMKNLNDETYRIATKDNATGVMALAVRAGKMTFLQFWEALKNTFLTIPFLDNLEMLRGGGTPVSPQRAHHGRAVHLATEATGENEDECECGAATDAEGEGCLEEEGIFMALGEAEAETVNAQYLPAAMTGVYVVEKGGLVAPEAAMGANEKICWSCGKPGHLSNKCPDYDKNLPMAPPDARRRLQRNHVTGKLRMAEAGRTFGSQGVTEKGRAASGKTVPRGNLFGRGGSQQKK
jgi:hypothetical protein